MQERSVGEAQRSMTSEGKAAEIEALIAPSLSELGYQIVRILLAGNRQKTLQIMIERSDGKNVDVEDCAAVSRAAEALLDVEDPIAGGYTLEVSSPGIDRPLTRLDDFRRYKGFDARIELARAYSGQRRFSGRLSGTEGETVLLDAEEGQLAIPFSEIKKAKLILTDALLAAHAEGATPSNGDGRD